MPLSTVNWLECKHDDSKEPKDCGEQIRMTWIQSISGDYNQDGLALIWRCNVSKYLTKSDLIHQTAAAAVVDGGGGGQSSVRVRLFLKRRRHDPTGPPYMAVTQFDIPLHTAVIGYGGPTIRHNQHGYFSQHQQQVKSRNVGLCLTAYGMDSQRYLLEFVHHHLNVGIAHIVIGIIRYLDSEEIHLAEQLLRPFIDHGFVSIQAIGLDYFIHVSAMCRECPFIINACIISRACMNILPRGIWMNIGCLPSDWK